MMMPRMGGYPVLEHFRGKTDAPPIIMITANEGSRHKAYAEYLGVVDYIRKPFAMERLLEAVNKAFAAAGDRPKRRRTRSSAAIWTRSKSSDRPSRSGRRTSSRSRRPRVNSNTSGSSSVSPAASRHAALLRPEPSANSSRRHAGQARE